MGKMTARQVVEQIGVAVVADELGIPVNDVLAELHKERLPAQWYLVLRYIDMGLGSAIAAKPYELFDFIPVKTVVTRSNKGDRHE